MEEIKRLYLVELIKEIPYLNFKIGTRFEFPDTIEQVGAEMIYHYNRDFNNVIKDSNVVRILYNYFIFDILNNSKGNDYVKLINKVEVGNIYITTNKKIEGELQEINPYNLDEEGNRMSYMCTLSNNNEFFTIYDLIECKLKFDIDSLNFIFNKIKDSDKTLNFQILKLGKDNSYIIILNKVYSSNTLKEKIMTIAESYNSFDSLELHRCVLASNSVNKCCLTLTKV